ncbi:MAG TPA: ISKra4 family transposase [Solirubrobacteraceae bacterium]|nr:ISKra4 family transposase [Solirubrobacteraceae bacterium]
MGEILPDQRSAASGARDVASPDLPAGSCTGRQGFSASDGLYGALTGWLSGEEAQGLEHGELEEHLESKGRELVRQLYQDSIDLRAAREQRVAPVVGADGVARSNVERAHERSLQTVFGEVTVSRLAYRARGAENLYVADAGLNLPEEKHSHGLRRLAALGAPQGSFEDLREAICRQTGVEIGKRQVEELARRAAVDFEAFYEQRERDAAQRQEVLAEREQVLVLSCDGKGVVMRPEALRPETRRKAENSQPKMGSRLSKGEKRARKRIAEVTAVYEVKPVPRTPADVLPATEQERNVACDGPQAKHKWVSASVTDDAATMIERMFEEALRRDPARERTWVALVDGNNHQIDRIRTEARRRKVKVKIVVDCMHVLEYLWSAAWSFFDEGDAAAERWVKEKARQVLEGNAGVVAASIRRKATCLHLDAKQRANADTCADYLLAKRPYLDYPTALASGWPIATGVIEGACRHVVKDRMDITGARWGLEGAEAVLKLRALKVNGDIDAYWRFHLAQERKRVHETHYASAVIPTAPPTG